MSVPGQMVGVYEGHAAGVTTMACLWRLLRSSADMGMELAKRVQLAGKKHSREAETAVSGLVSFRVILYEQRVDVC